MFRVKHKICGDAYDNEKNHKTNKLEVKVEMIKRFKADEKKVILPLARFSKTRRKSRNK